MRIPLNTMEATRFIWKNGKLLEWAEATVHVGVHGLHYGTGVFEGIRAYETNAGPAVFRLSDHLARFESSARLIGMKMPYSIGELRDATLELLEANEVDSAYIRPIAFYGAGGLGVLPRSNDVDVAIMAWPWGAYLGEEALKHGIRVQVSTWERVGANTIPHAAKATGVYLNSMLAVQGAVDAGFDEAILLTPDGYVADGSGENVFVVRDGVLFTPDLSASILPGITRATILEMAQDLGYRVVEKALVRSDLYLADEVFLTGTAAEVTPVRHVDGHTLGPPGPLTLELQKAYDDTVHGRVPRRQDWLDPVSQSRDTAVAKSGSTGS